MLSKKIISFIIFAALFIAITGSTAFCDTDTSKPTISVGSAEAQAGGEVTIPVVLKNCPCFGSIGIEVDYPDELTLLSTDYAKINATRMGAEYYNVKPYNMSWYNMNNCDYNGLLVNLTFRVSEDAEPGDYNVTVDYYKGRDGKYVDGESTNFYYTESGAYSPIGLQYESGSVSVKSDISEVVVNAFGQQVSLSSDYPVSGIIFVSLYNDNEKTEPVEVKVFNAKKTINYTTNKTGTSMTVMWWASVDGSLQPVCDKVELSLQ